MRITARFIRAQSSFKRATFKFKVKRPPTLAASPFFSTRTLYIPNFGRFRRRTFLRRNSDERKITGIQVLTIKTKLSGEGRACVRIPSFRERFSSRGKEEENGSSEISSRLRKKMWESGRARVSRKCPLGVFSVGAYTHTRLAFTNVL